MITGGAVFVNRKFVKFQEKVREARANNLRFKGILSLKRLIEASKKRDKLKP